MQVQEHVKRGLLLQGPLFLRQGCLPSVSSRRVSGSRRRLPAPGRRHCKAQGFGPPRRRIWGPAGTDPGFSGYFSRKRCNRWLAHVYLSFILRFWRGFPEVDCQCMSQELTWAWAPDAAVEVAPGERPGVESWGTQAWAGVTRRGNPRNVLPSSSLAWARPGACPWPGESTPSFRSARWGWDQIPKQKLRSTERNETEQIYICNPDETHIKEVLLTKHGDKEGLLSKECSGKWIKIWRGKKASSALHHKKTPSELKC